MHRLAAKRVVDDVEAVQDDGTAADRGRTRTMQIAIPNTTFQSAGVRLAPRPGSLAGATIGFLDGWGFREADGTISMYPLMRELHGLLRERYGIADIVWQKKKNVAQRAPKAQLRELAERCAVVINGEAA
jgi:hypothetical protein